MPDDKAKLLNDAHDASLQLLGRYPNSPHVLRLFGEVCLEIFKVTGDYDFVDEVRGTMQAAETETGDHEVTQASLAFERRLTRASNIEASPEFTTEELDQVDLGID